MEEHMNTLFKSLLLSLALIAGASKGMELPSVDDRFFQFLKEEAEKRDFTGVGIIIQCAAFDISKVLVSSGYYDRLLTLMFQAADTSRINSILKLLLESRHFSQLHKDLIAQAALGYAFQYNKEAIAKNQPITTTNDYLSPEDAEEYIKALAFSEETPVTVGSTSHPAMVNTPRCIYLPCSRPAINIDSTQIRKTNCCGNIMCNDHYHEYCAEYSTSCPACKKPNFTIKKDTLNPSATVAYLAATVDADAECPGRCAQTADKTAQKSITKTQCCGNFICYVDYLARASYGNKCPFCRKVNFTAQPAIVKPTAPVITSPKPAAAPKAKAPALPTVKGTDACNICTYQAKDCDANQIYRTKCCKQFICLDDAQRLQKDAADLYKKLQDPVQRRIMSSSPDFTHWPDQKTPHAKCPNPYCKNEKLEIEKAAI
jgi:hypothetical protein